MKVNNKTKQLALASILSSLAVAFMLLAEFTPVIPHMVRWVSAACIIIILNTCGHRIALMSVGVVAILSTLLMPNPFGFMDFALLYGTYPIVKTYFDKIPHKPTRIAVKSIYFALYVAITTAFSFFVFGSANMLAGFAQHGPIWLAVAIAAGLFYASWYEWFFIRAVNDFWEKRLKHMVG
ncbi:MAG: hypothetical protein FWF59_10625 [Turicibacter sp.]|nr:hypothetical protein [Turicibacter sp.]